MMKKRGLTILLTLTMILGYMAFPAIALPGSAGIAFAADGPVWGFDDDQPYAGGWNFSDQEGYETLSNSIDVTLDIPEEDSIGDYVKIELADEQGGAPDSHFSLDLEPLEYGWFNINVAEGLPGQEDPHICLVNMYYDPTGQGSFGQEPYKQGRVQITIYPVEEYDVYVNWLELGTLHPGYTQQQANAAEQSLIIENQGSKPLTFDAEGITWDDYTNAFEITRSADLPVTITAGESAAVATVKPVVGQALGNYNAWFEICDTEGHVSKESVASYYVGKEGLNLEPWAEELVFETKPVGFTEADVETRWIGFENTGDVPLKITGITAPGNGLFTVQEDDEYDILVPGNEKTYKFSLDPASALASQEGTHTGTFTVTAKEMAWDEDEWEYVEVPGGRTTTATLSVKVKVTSATYKITIDRQGAGDDLVIENVPEGSLVRWTANDKIEEAYPEADYPNGPVMDGKVYLGIYMRPYSEYESWEDMENNPEYGRHVLDELRSTEDVTIYFAWADALEGGDITIEEPLAGEEAGEPVLTLPAGAKYRLFDEDECWAPSWMVYDEEEEGYVPFTGTFDAGGRYAVSFTLFADQGYGFPRTEGLFTVNGEAATAETQGVFCRVIAPVEVQDSDDTEYTIRFWYVDKDGLHKYTEQTVTGRSSKVTKPEGVPEAEGQTFTGKWRTYMFLDSDEWDFDDPISKMSLSGGTGNLYADCTPWSTYVKTYDRDAGTEGGGTVQYDTFEPAGAESEQEWDLATLFYLGGYRTFYPVADEGYAFVEWMRVPAGGAPADEGNETLPDESSIWGNDHVVSYSPKEDGESLYAVFRELTDLSGAKVSGIAAMTYTGKTLTPKPKVTLEGVTLTEGTDYTLTYGDNVNAGTAKVTITGKGNYCGTVRKTFAITKAANPLTIKAKTATVKYSKLKKKNQTLAVTKVITFTKKGQGTMSYTLSSAKKGSKSFKKYFKINKTTGKVTVKKGLKKGTYKVKVKVKAAGNSNYNASAVKTVTFKVKVK